MTGHQTACKLRVYTASNPLKHRAFPAPIKKHPGGCLFFQREVEVRLNARRLGCCNVLDGQLDTAAVVHVQYQHFHFLAFFQDIGHFLYASVAQHRDVNQTVLAWQDVDECAEVDDALNLTDVDLADFSFRGDAQDALTSRFSRFLGFAEDLDRAVVFDVDRSLGLFTDRTNGRAAFTDDITDFVGVDFHRDHGRSIFRQLGAGLTNDLVHLAEDVQARFQGLAQGDLHDLFGDDLDLDVHLQRGDAFGGTGYLEVHVAEVVFVTQDVGQDGELLALFDQTHGDTGNRCLHRHTGVHQGQGSAADRSHGARTVGFGDFRNHTDGVRECSGIRQHGLDRTTGQTTVTDFTTACTAHATTLTDRERREVVVQHEGVFFLAFQGVQQLCITGSTQCCNNQGLGFATGEQGRTVGLGQNTDFDVQRTYGLGVAAVDTWLAVDDVFANGAVFDFAESGFHFAGGRLAFFTGQLGNHLVFQLAQTRVTVGLDGDGVGLGDRVAELGTDRAQQGGGFWSGSPGPGWLGSFGGQLFDSLDNHLEFIVGEQHGAQHLVFGQLFGFRFNHQYRFRGTGNDHVQARRFLLFVSRVQQVAGAFVESHARGADRAIERNTGDGQGCRGTDHRSDVRIGLLAGGDDGADNLHFVHETFREQRADRTVDQARSQGFFFGRTAFTLEEATRDLAGSVGFFLVVHGQREEAFAWVRVLGTNDSHQYADVVVNGDQYCAGSLTGDTACLEGDGRLTELEFFDDRVHGVLPSFVALGELVSLRNSWATPGIGPTVIVRMLSSGKAGAQIKLEAGSLPCAGGKPADAQQTTNLIAQSLISDADPGDRSERCNGSRPCLSGSPAACDAG